MEYTFILKITAVYFGVHGTYKSVGTPPPSRLRTPPRTANTQIPSALVITTLENIDCEQLSPMFRLNISPPPLPPGKIVAFRNLV